jgi:GMP synthase (glutamine-hydrolysing)
VERSVPDRLKTRFQVQAAVRAGTVQNIPVMVARRGDEDAGVILLKLNRSDLGCEVLAQTRSGGGELAWQRVTGPAPVPEAEADAYIARAVTRDPDLWVIEIEDRAARPLFPGAIL